MSARAILRRRAQLAWFLIQGWLQAGMYSWHASAKRFSSLTSSFVYLASNPLNASESPVHIAVLPAINMFAPSSCLEALSRLSCGPMALVGQLQLCLQPVASIADERRCAPSTHLLPCQMRHGQLAGVRIPYDLYSHLQIIHAGSVFHHLR